MHIETLKNPSPTGPNPADAWHRIATWARELGFQEIGIADTDLSAAEAGLLNWLADGSHGAMDYMARHGLKRARPAELAPGTLRILCVRMNYMAANAADPETVLADGDRGYVSRYALGRDYHKVLRTRLQQLIDRMRLAFGDYVFRAFTDSAPVMEVALAEKAGIGWRGKHTLLLDRSAGSYFFLGEIYTNLPLPTTSPTSDHCGSCTRCIDACPTGAIVGPYRLDARRCISYLTIEHPGSIPEPLRPAMGNRIYGCDDCQLACPWNKYAQTSDLPDFAVRNGLDGAHLADLFAWSESEFTERLAGSAIRRIGYERWLRNVAVALGNAPSTPTVVAALESRFASASPIVREHVAWALAQHRARACNGGLPAGNALGQAGGN
ncbi:MAG: tRNA epoxyqueuosine(34) reductase QueG [Betaproteobacteria bacterium]